MANYSYLPPHIYFPARRAPRLVVGQPSVLPLPADDICMCPSTASPLHVAPLLPLVSPMNRQLDVSNLFLFTVLCIFHTMIKYTKDTFLCSWFRVTRQNRDNILFDINIVILLLELLYRIQPSLFFGLFYITNCTGGG